MFGNLDGERCFTHGRRALYNDAGFIHIYIHMLVKSM